ncbi:MAG: lysine--tRNA ligase [Candidatus Woykebacteria bacterium]
MFWADIVAKEAKIKEPILVNDAKTPSGKIHVGSLRGVMIHDFVYKSFIGASKKASYTYHFDDFDPMDALPANLPKEKYEKYMGTPLKDIPAPEGSVRYSDYYAEDFIRVFNSLGAEPKIIWAFKDLYKAGKLDGAIKIVLENATKIQEIYHEISGSKKEKDWYPFQPVCEKCGKIGTTRVFAWDGKEVSYKCEKELVKWAFGCGHEGKVSPFGGSGKIPYKVEWSAKWFALGVNFEGAGKDHTSKGGTRDVANHIAEEVFKIEPPEDLPYEFFIYGGRKMSSSKGVGASASDVAQILPLNLLRFLMARFQPKVAIDFDPTRSDTIPNLFDEYDRAREEYFQDVESDLGRTFEAGYVGKPVKVFTTRFSTLANWLRQPGISVDEEAKRAKGADLSKEEKDALEERTHYARIWLENFAPDNMKPFKFSEKKETALSEKQLKLLSALSKRLEKELADEEVQNQIFQLATSFGLSPKEAFQTLYQVLIGQTQGPRISSLITDHKEKTKEILNRYE